MELKTAEIIISILIPILSAVAGGWFGAYIANKYREKKESREKEKVRDIALRALNILKSYSGKSYREAEGELTGKCRSQRKGLLLWLYTSWEFHLVYHRMIHSK